MKISELIEKLEKTKEKVGDLEVFMFQTHDAFELEIHTIALCKNEQGVIEHVTIVDLDTALSFDEE